MKRTVSGKVKRATTARTVYYRRILVIFLYILVASILIALKISSRSADSFFSIFTITSVIVTGVGMIMLASRVAMGLIPVATVGFLLNDSLGRPLYFEGLFFWLLATVIGFLIAFSYLSRFIAPPMNQDLNNNRSSYLGLLLLIQYAFRDLLRPKKHKVIPGQLPESFETIGAGSIPSYNAISIFKGNKYISGFGPGYSLLANKWNIFKLIDLRPQSRKIDLPLTTRDGINVISSVSVRYRIRKPKKKQPDRVPYKYDRDAIRDITFATTVIENHGELECFEQIPVHAMLYATEYASRRTLDELLSVNDREVQMLRTIADEVKNRLVREYTAKGVEIESVGLGTLFLPDDVYKTRVKQWTAGWKAPISAQGLGSGIKPLSPENAALQLEVLEELVGNLDTIRASSNLPEEMKDAISEQLHRIVTDAATEGMLRTLIPAPKESKK